MKMIAAFTPARRPFAAIGLLTILGLVGLTDAQVPSPALPRSSPSTAQPLAAIDSPSAAAVTSRAVDEAIASEIAERFEGDRRKFLEHLKSRGITQREFRREMEASLLAGTGGATPSAAPIPKPIAPYVLFLVNASETMRTEFSFTANSAGAPAPNRERGQPYVAQPPIDDAQARAAAKWQRTADALELMLLALNDGTNFHVAVFADNAVTAIANRALAHNPRAIPNAAARLRAVVPRGAANLEAAFTFVNDALPPPERIVLITDGLPTASAAEPMQGQVAEAQRIKALQAATRRLPPRIPVHTVLVAAPTADPAAPGLYWELANATRGQLTVPAKNIAESRTHLAFVIDTSGSMRDPNTGGLWPIVTSTIESALDTHAELAGLQFLDADGRFILGRPGTGAAGWLPNNVETREKLRTALRSYKQDTVSNPVPGVANAIRFLRDKSAPELRMGIYVLGDEFNSSDNAGVILDRLDGLNPRDAHGRRAVTISAIGFPTTIRYQFSMGNTGLRFANLMRQLTAEHDGSFIALADL